MSDYIHIEKEYFNIMDLEPITDGSRKIILGYKEVILLSKIISMADINDNRKNSNHACRCSNAYFMDLIHCDERTLQRSLSALEKFNLVYKYEYKAEKHLTKARYIFPNWNYINEICGTELKAYEIPEYVVSNTEKQGGDKIVANTPPTPTNLSPTPDKNVTLIIDSNRYNVLDFPFPSDDGNGNEESMDYTVMEMLYAYLKYEKEVMDIASNMEKNINTLSESEIKEQLESSGFDIHMYSDYRNDIKKGCALTLRSIEDDKRYEEEEKQREIEQKKKKQDEEDAWLEQQMELLNCPFFDESEGIA